MTARPEPSPEARQLLAEAAADYSAAEQQRQLQSNRDDAGLRARAAEDAGAERSS